MNKEKSLERLAALEAEATQLREIIEAPGVRGQWKPEGGDEYWYVGPSGVVYKDDWIMNDTDKGHLAMGNVYRTGEEAEKARDIQLATVRIQDALIEHSEYELDWGDRNQEKWEISCDHLNESFYPARYVSWQSLGTIHGTEKACKWVIDNLPDDLRLVAGVE